MPFVSGFRAGSAEPSQTLWFGFRGNKLLVKIEDGTARIPLAAEADSLQTPPLWRHYFGSWNEMACYAVSMSEETPLGAGFEWMGLRQLFGKIEEELVWVA